MSPRHFSDSYRDRRYRTHHYYETKERELENKVESLARYLWRKLWRKR